MHRIPPPEPRALLLPILACLPIAFFSPRPPPALLPLLSPILRQRVHLHSSSNASSDRSSPNNSHNRQASNWLQYLTWSPARAANLVEVVGGLNLEPHPVSGELELFGDDDEEDGEVGKLWYKRLDAETLQARCSVREHGLAVVWVWCRNDTGGVGLEALQGDGAAVGQAEDAWKVAEVLASHDADEDWEDWYGSMAAAEEAFHRYKVDEDGEESPITSKSRTDGQPWTTNPVPTKLTTITDAQKDDDDDYWASYDRTPSTPAAKRPSGPTTAYNSSAPSTTTRGRPGSATSETAYFARYGNEVQPALDAHDPDEELPNPEESQSTLHGNTIASSATTSASTDPRVNPNARSSPSSALSSTAQPSPQRADTHRTRSPSGRRDSEFQHLLDAIPAHLQDQPPSQAQLQQEEQTRALIDAEPPESPSRQRRDSQQEQRRQSGTRRAWERPVRSGGGLDGVVMEEVGTGEIHKPRPASSAVAREDGRGDGARLEREAQVGEVTAAEVGVKQHISMEIKSLFRLAKSVGIERREFERVVRTELEVLKILEEE